MPKVHQDILDPHKAKSGKAFAGARASAEGKLKKAGNLEAQRALLKPKEQATQPKRGGGQMGVSGDDLVWNSGGLKVYGGHVFYGGEAEGESASVPVFRLDASNGDSFQLAMRHGATEGGGHWYRMECLGATGFSGTKGSSTGDFTFDVKPMSGGATLDYQGKVNVGGKSGTIAGRIVLDENGVVKSVSASVTGDLKAHDSSAPELGVWLNVSPVSRPDAPAEPAAPPTTVKKAEPPKEK